MTAQQSRTVRNWCVLAVLCAATLARNVHASDGDDCQSIDATTGAASQCGIRMAGLRVTDTRPIPSAVRHDIPCAPPCGFSTAACAVPAGECDELSAGPDGELPAAHRWRVTPPEHACECYRAIEDDFVTGDDLRVLQSVLNKGLERTRRCAPPETSDAGPGAWPVACAGPSLLDVGSGLMREAARTDVRSVYAAGVRRSGERIPPTNFTDEELRVYMSTHARMLQRVQAHTHTDAHMYLTAPTFITRIRGAPAWTARTVHDEYFHPHVDGATSVHYHASALLYLSAAGTDFTGGEFDFFARLPKGAVPPPPCPDDSAPEDVSPSASDRLRVCAHTHEDGHTYVLEHTVLPRPGRLLIFTSGAENLHRVRRVARGERAVFSMWYTFSSPHAYEHVYGNGSSRGAFRGAGRLVPLEV